MISMLRMERSCIICASTSKLRGGEAALCLKDLEGGIYNGMGSGLQAVQFDENSTPAGHGTVRASRAAGTTQAKGARNQ